MDGYGTLFCYSFILKNKPSQENIKTSRNNTLNIHLHDVFIFSWIRLFFEMDEEQNEVV